MKANKAPEKIHIQPNAHDRWFEGNIPNGLPNGLFVEYTRTDVFVEKAVKWLENNLQGIVGGSTYIEDFRNYMKGE